MICHICCRCSRTLPSRNKCNDMSYLLPLLSRIAFKNAPKELDVAEEAVRTLSISINPSI